MPGNRGIGIILLIGMGITWTVAGSALVGAERKPAPKSAVRPSIVGENWAKFGTKREVSQAVLPSLWSKIVTFVLLVAVLLEDLDTVDASGIDTDLLGHYWNPGVRPAPFPRTRGDSTL